jgi:ketol-acid reductoisomerase
MSNRLAQMCAGLVVLVAACGNQGSTQTQTQIQKGGDLVIARVADSQSMDKANVFDNESIWILD